MDKNPCYLTLKEHKVLWELKCNSYLAINKADIGSTIVVRDRTEYTRDVFEHLSDPNTYKELNGDPTESKFYIINFTQKEYLTRQMGTVSRGEPENAYTG